MVLLASASWLLSSGITLAVHGLAICGASAPSVTVCTELATCCGEVPGQASSGEADVMCQAGMSEQMVPSAQEDPAGTSWLRSSGRFMYDWIHPDRQLAGSTEARHELRRARILARGVLTEDLTLRVQADFGMEEATLLEWFLDWGAPSLGTLRTGHFREPFGLDARTSSAHLTFMERSAPSEAFTFGRNQGVQIGDRSRRHSWDVGCFREASGSSPGNQEDNTAATARLTWLPVRADDDSRLIHLGLGLTFRDTEDGGARLAAPPGANLVEQLVDTGELDLDRLQVLGVEGAAVFGPQYLQGEVFFARLDSADSDSSTLEGGYLQGSWFLTGEHKAYRDTTRSFGPVQVLRPALDGPGTGAWELALRWSHTNLSSGAVSGGVMDNLTLGLNWYVNTHTRMMLNYIRTDTDAGRPDGNLLMMRAQIGF